jgi:hypothetical protein
MDGMTDEEIDAAIDWYDKGLEVEDIYEHFDERIPYPTLQDLITCYEDDLMQHMGAPYYYA